MTQQQFAQLLTDLVSRRIITRDEAASLLQRFIDGDISPDELPLPPGEAQSLGQVSDAQIFAFLLLALGIRRAPGTRLRQNQRDRLRTRLRDQYDTNIEQVGRRIERGDSIRETHQYMKDEMTRYTGRQYAAGRGQPGGVGQYLAPIMGTQYAFLYRFFGEISARALLGRPYSERNVLSRSKMYQGPGWTAWFQGNEQNLTRVGQIVDFIARDDERTCINCSDAARNGPYLVAEGPFPGTHVRCLGGGLCRCVRRVRFDMEAWLDLTGNTAGAVLVPLPQRQAA